MLEDFDRIIQKSQRITLHTTHLCGADLGIEDVVRIARHGEEVAVTRDETVLRRVEASREFVLQALTDQKAIYGVTTGFGGMANVAIPRDELNELQTNLLWFHKTGASKKLSVMDVRASMVLRANSLLRGASGVRIELIERLIAFLNAGVTPHVFELGSIGASGDLVPLSYIAGAMTGAGVAWKVDFQAEEIDAVTMLQRLCLAPIQLQPKEGLALINGTSVMTGIAVNCVYDLIVLLNLVISIHALIIQGLGGRNQPFHPFIHAQKPHPGQGWAAARLLMQLDGSQLIRNDINGHYSHENGELFQDRYSVRCLPQYMGPVVDGLAQIARQVATEINSSNDNPLIDSDNQVAYHGGNFLGQYIGVGMDQLRNYIGLLAKHLDVQIGLLVAPEFNNRLPASLIGNPARTVNMGFKGLQLTGNSIVPMLTFLGNTMVDRYPTYAEQFNQNINSQGFASANLARQSISIFQQYIAIALMFGVQAVDLRTYVKYGHYDARRCLSPHTSIIYETFKEIVGHLPSKDRPYVWDDNDQALDEHILKLVTDIQSDGKLVNAVNDILENTMIHL